MGDTTSCGPTGKATSRSTGLAVAPVDAPRSVKRAIRFANKIVDLPYRLGGGHRLPWKMDNAYDCSGTVSWALHGARLLKSPVPSGNFKRWGAYGPGQWITVYYNAGHAFMTIAGLRLDTSQVPGSGPGWSTTMVSSAGYASVTRRASRNPARALKSSFPGPYAAANAHGNFVHTFQRRLV